MKKATIVIPTFNESDNIGILASKIREACSGLRFNILVMDDSLDNKTAEAAQRAGCMVIHRQGKERGLSRAVIDGIKAADSANIVVMDGDLQHDPKYLPRLFEALEHHDFVVMSRYVDGGGCAEWDLDRKAISRVANLATRPLTSVRDAVSGFFGFRKSGLLELKAVDDRGFKIMLELLVKGHWGSIAEVPYTFGVRTRGQTKMRWEQVKDYLVQLVGLYLWKFRFLRFGLVGGVGVGVNLFFLWLFTSVVGIHYMASFALAFVLAMTSNYILNSLWTFKEKAGGKLGYLKYFFVASATLPLDEALLYLFTDVWGVWYVLSAAMAIMIVFGIRYEVAKKWIWRKAKARIA